LSSQEKPEPHPQPDRINSVVLPTHIIKTNCTLSRIHKSLGRDNQKRNAIYFDRSNQSRFNALAGEYGILYAGLDNCVAFRETSRVYSDTPIPRDFLAPNCLSVIYPQRDLILVDLSGAGLTKIGADARLITGTYSLSQVWSQALYNHADRIDGLYYRSRFDPSRFCVALYDDRVSPAELKEERITSDNLLDRSFEPELEQILDEYGYQLDDEDNPEIRTNP
jgi:RES domain